MLPESVHLDFPTFTARTIVTSKARNRLVVIRSPTHLVNALKVASTKNEKQSITSAWNPWKRKKK